MKRALQVLAAGVLAIAAFGCRSEESSEAPTGTKSQDKFEMSGDSGADKAGGGSAKAGSESEAGDS